MAGTRWARVDLTYLRNPKIRGLPAECVLLHLASILYCAEHLTDGHIPIISLTELGHSANISPYWVRRRVRCLVDRGLWIESPDGWTLHGFEDTNPQAMRHAVEAERESWRVRQHRRRHPDVTA